MTSIALDQSTSATKALLVDQEGRVLKTAAKTHTQHYPQPGWVEHDAEEIWQNTLAVLGELLEETNHEDQPSFISITNQRETLVVFDRATGQPLGKAIVWQCVRSQEICQDLAQEGRAVEIERKTGLKLNPYFSGSKIAWIMQNEPDTARAISEGKALIGTIDTYLIYRLTEGRVYATDPSNASRTLLFDLETRTWNSHLAETFRIKTEWLAEIKDCDGQFGSTTLGGQLKSPIPICGVMGDAQASLLSQKCLEPGDAKVTIGTGSFLLVKGQSVMPQQPTPLLKAMAWVIRGEPAYGFEGVIYIAGAALQWLRDSAQLVESIEEASALAASVPDSGGVVFVPSFTGLGSPYWSTGAKAAFLGLSLGTTRANMVRAVFESLCFPIRDQIEALESSLGIKVSSLAVDGGASSDPWLMQLMADICQVPLTPCQDSNASALGAWSAGMLGMNPDLNLDWLPSRSSDPVLPKASPESADELYRGWKVAVQALVSLSS
jgi:glycerol kinase